MFSLPRTSSFVPTMVRSSQSSKRECTLSAAIAQRSRREQQRAAEHHEQRGGHIEQHVEQERACHGGAGRHGSVGSSIATVVLPVISLLHKLGGAEPRQRRQIFQIFGDQQSGGAGIGPPAVEMHVVVDDRIGDQGHAWHGAGELGQRARHMIVRRYHDDRSDSGCCATHWLVSVALSIVLRASLSISTQQEKNWSPWLASCFSSSVVVVRLTPVISRRFAFCSAAASSPCRCGRRRRSGR